LFLQLFSLLLWVYLLFYNFALFAPKKDVAAAAILSVSDAAGPNGLKKIKKKNAQTIVDYLTLFSLYFSLQNG
jgi:hypothetical protein